MNTSTKRAGIVGIGSSIPEKILPNSYFETIVETTDEWIVSRTGIKERRVAPPEEAASHLGTRAAIAAMKHAGVTADEIDLIICATITADLPLPATASIIQDNLGAKKAGAFDLQAGCSGFVYGISVASGLVNSGMYQKILVIGSDLLSRLTDYEDRATCVLFGDGAGAAVIAPVEDGGILSVVLGSDGSGAEALKIDAGGTRLPTSAETVANRQHYMKMAGQEVFKFAVKIMGEAAIQALDKAGLTPDDIDLLIPHQANIRIIESAARRLKLPMEKVFVNVHKYGNTSAASIPIALVEAYQEGRIKKGDTIVTVGFGAGLTWAANVIKWGIDS